MRGLFDMATIAHNLRLQGFKANRSIRGKTLTLARTGAEFVGIVNTSDGPVDYYGNGNMQIRSELCFLRSDIGDVIPAADDKFTDSADGVVHVITDAPNWMHDPLLVMFKCRVEKV